MHKTFQLISRNKWKLTSLKLKLELLKTEVWSSEMNSETSFSSTEVIMESIEGQQIKEKPALVLNSVDVWAENGTYLLLLLPYTVETACSSHDHSFSTQYHRQIAPTRHNHAPFQSFLKDRNHMFVRGGNDVLFVRQPNFPEFPPFFFFMMSIFFPFFFKWTNMPAHTSDMLRHFLTIITIATFSVSLN